MAENKKLVPKRRFKGFTGNWEQRKLGEVVDVCSGRDYKHLSLGDIPVYGTGGYMLSVSSALSFDKDAIGIGRKGTIDKPYILNAPFWTVDTLFYAIPRVCYNLYFVYGIYQNIDWRQKDESTGVPSLSKVSINCVEVKVPKFSEQQQIGSFFSHLDNLITLQQRKLEKTKALKAAYLSEMFPQEGEKVPKRRFAGFTDDWEQSKLGEVMNVTSVKRIHQSDWTTSGIRFLRARDIISSAKNEEPDNYLYISQEKYDEYSTVSGKVTIGDMLVTGVGTIGIPLLITDLEPLYFKDGNIIWFQNDEKIDGYFFYFSFWGNKIRDFINKSAGIGTVGTYTIENGKNTPILLPEKAEQAQIGNFFKHLDNLITHQQRKLEKLKDIKKAYLNEMFI